MVKPPVVFAAVLAIGFREDPVARSRLSSACKNTPPRGQNLIEMPR
jgi:hypothetical protein